MIEKLKNEEVEEVITTELFSTNDYGEKEVYETTTEKTGYTYLKKPTISEIVDKINEILEKLNAEVEK